MLRTAFVDEQLLAKGFNTGDVVRKAGPRDFVLSPYVGRVLFSNTETGTVSVQWPWGAEQEQPSQLVVDKSEYYVPTNVDTSFHTWESERHRNDAQTMKDDQKWRRSVASRILTAYEKRTLPLWRAACEAWHCQMGEVEAYRGLIAAMGEDFGTDTVRRTVSNVYESGRRLAIYWKDSKRRYRVTQKEKSSGKYVCPRCRELLKPRVYRQGLRLLACKSCGFAIHPEDLI